MPSFLDKLRAGTASGSSSAAGTGKRDPKDAQLTWLQKLQRDEDPVQSDGSDKFFGAENFGNTCYFNSMLQSLYYSVPFREMVLSYPMRCSQEAVLNDAEGNPRKLIRDGTQANGQAVSSPKKPAASTPTPVGKPEDKESPDYKKKQAMAAGPVVDLDYDNAAAYGMSPSLFTCLKDTFDVVVANSSRTGVISMPRFLEMLRQDHDMFRSAMHQDAHEFLNILLNGVIESVEQHTKDLESEEQTPSADATTKKAPITASESKQRYADFKELFQGTLTSETRCLTCENVSQRDEPFLDLSVDLEQHSSVTSCLRAFSDEEMLCERDKFSCDRCGTLQEAEKRMKIKRLPRILALHLKRFKYTEDLQRLQKLFHRVVYPYHLRVFNTTDDAEDPDKLYELYAVVVHIGSGPYHGHYVAIIKTPERGWLLFDDESVEPVDKGFVKNFFGAQPGMACAYVLFYQETTLEAVKKEQELEAMAAAREAAEARQPVAKETKESHGISLGMGMGLKINGVPVPTSPTIAAHEDVGAQLAHTASAPAHLVSPQSPGVPPLSPKGAVTPANTLSANHTPALKPSITQPTSPSQTPTKAEKKQAAKDEKERKAAEKEREKAEKAAEKARRKSMETRSKAQAAVVRSTIVTGKKPETTPSNTSGSGDGITSTTSSAGAAPAAPTGNILPAPAIPVSSPQPLAAAPSDGDEIAPAPLPSAGSPAIGAVSIIPETKTTITANNASNSTGSLSPKDKDKDSAWPSFNHFSLRRSSKGSSGKKPKLWDRIAGSDSNKNGSAGAAGTGALAVAPTSNPSSSAPASSMPIPHPPLHTQAAARGTNAGSDDFAVEETDSGTEGGVEKRSDEWKEVAPRPTSYDGGNVRVWRPPQKEKPPPVPPMPPMPAAVPTAPNTGHLVRDGAQVPPNSHSHVPARREESKPPAAGVSYSTIPSNPPSILPPAGASHSTIPSNPPNIPAPNTLGTEVAPGGKEGGTGIGGKKRGFSSIRKKASSLLS